MKRATALISLLLLSPWTATDILLEATSEALIFIDWGQTIWHQSQTFRGLYPDESGVLRMTDIRLYSEGNPILGKHPSIGKINTYFISWLILHPVISLLLPKPFRTLWQGGTIALEGYIIGKNFYKGSKFQFPIR